MSRMLSTIGKRAERGSGSVAVREVFRPVRLCRPVRGVLFDMCDVLYDATVWRRWVLRLLSHMGVYTNYRCFFRVWEREYLAEVQRGRRDFWEAFESLLRSVGLSEGQIGEVKAASVSRRRQLENDPRPLPGVRTMLARLHGAGLVLGAVSNSLYPASFLQACLDRFTVGRMFSAVVSSIDLGQTMPDPIVYQTALERMRLPAREVAFVGHDTAELDGAAALGMATIAFNFDPQARADAYLSRLDEISDVLKNPVLLPAAG
jgi:FMN phosphatase YigB (HAD superfamily)